MVRQVLRRIEDHGPILLAPQAPGHGRHSILQQQVCGDGVSLEGRLLTSPHRNDPRPLVRDGWPTTAPGSAANAWFIGRLNITWVQAIVFRPILALRSLA